MGGLVPAFMVLSTTVRRDAMRLDREGSLNGKYLKKFVEVLREQFQKIFKEKAKRAACVWVVCELLRAYFHLGQVSQCSFLLKAITQAHSDIDPEKIPRAIGFTLYFCWGKHSVFDHSVRDAVERLTWALTRCSPTSSTRGTSRATCRMST